MNALHAMSGVSRPKSAGVVVLSYLGILKYTPCLVILVHRRHGLKLGSFHKGCCLLSYKLESDLHRNAYGDSLLDYSQGQ
jgi:hypothetical protein